MINEQLLNPQSIVVIGGSNNTHKPGGSIVRNLLSGGYQGELRIVNPKEDQVQGIPVLGTLRPLQSYYSHAAGSNTARLHKGSTGRRKALQQV